MGDIMGINDHMSTSEDGLQFIRLAEGKGLPGKPFEAYLCSSKVPTIGYGHTKGVTYEDVRNGRKITPEQAEAYLRKDVVRWELAVERATHDIPLTQSQYDVYISFAHNCGEGALGKVVAYHRKYGADAVPSRLMLYIYGTNRKTRKKYKSNGLLKRRTREIALWNSVPIDVPETDEPVPQSVAPDEGDYKAVVKKSGTFWGAIAALLGTLGHYISNAFTFAGDVIVETQNKLTLTDTLYNLLSDNLKELFVIVAVVGAIGVIWRRMKAEKEKKIA